MSKEDLSGRRISYEGHLCTVRWQGEIDGLKGNWLGVEWDDPSRGRHDGTYAGNRAKYGSENTPKGGDGKSSSIVISGKEVDEVGFDVISKKQSAWSDLTIISLDGLHIDSLYHQSPHLQQDHGKETINFPAGLNWKELDLSRNLFNDWGEISNICKYLRDLRVLKLNGNRFRFVQEEATHTFEKVAELGLANCVMGWDDVRTLCNQRHFPNLQCLSLAFNPLNEPPSPLLNLQLPILTTLDLASCNLCTLQTLFPLADLPALSTLNLRSNPLTNLVTDPSLIFSRLRTLDLTSTNLPNLSSLNPIPTTFPILSSFKTSNTPLTTSHPSSRLITIARLPGLTTLNNTPIPPHERQNADLYYLSTITPLILAANTAKEEEAIVKEHPQWGHLCEKYGEPESITKKRNSQLLTSEPNLSATGNNKEKIYPPLSLGVNLINFTFYFHKPISTSDPATPPHPNQQNQQQHTQSLPKQIDIYRLKAFLGRFYSIPSLELKLVLETDEWDPVPAAKPEDDDWSCSEDYSSDDERRSAGDGGDPRKAKAKGEEEEEGKQKDLWVRREIELVDSTRPVGFWVEGKEARVRVERRDLGIFE
ncbi:MAG: hypothetical protein Q9205_004757 [Flavoplaca limonia]